MRRRPLHEASADKKSDVGRQAHTDKTIVCRRNELRPTVAGFGDRRVEVLHRFSKPHADDEEAGQACNRDIRS